jgi:hypothetical protein
MPHAGPVARYGAAGGCGALIPAPQWPAGGPLAVVAGRMARMGISSSNGHWWRGNLGNYCGFANPSNVRPSAGDAMRQDEKKNRGTGNIRLGKNRKSLTLCPRPFCTSCTNMQNKLRSVESQLHSPVQ